MTATIDPTRAPFLADPGYRRLIAVLEADGERAMAVGGAVRNALMGIPGTDVDIATTALPETVMARARRAGLKAVPTGIEHGTVTVVVDHVGYEVTTLRSDVETDGRRATVAFTRDFAADAGRRDFTMNAIYADLDGRLTDPTGGVADALARRVRFIGDPHLRIREDYLRILRFFRFHAAFGAGEPDPAGLAACVELQQGLDRLSRERIGQEMRKLVVAPRAADTIRLMAKVGILAHVLGRNAHPEAFARFAALAAEAGHALTPAAALSVLADIADPEPDAEHLGERLRLSRAETAEIARLARLAADLGPAPDRHAVKLAVYRHGNEAAVAGLLAAAAKAGAGASPHLGLARSWTAPRFPVTGRQLLAEGHPPGPDLGRRLAELEAAWIAADFGEG